MKRLFSFGLFMLALARLAPGAPAPVWINIGTTNSPPSSVPSIDALSVINSGQLNLVLTNNPNGPPQVVPPFSFSDVLTYTNRGIFSCNTGFIFNDTPSSNGVPQRSASFGNANIGTIVGNGTNISINVAGILSIAGPILTISATNIVNNGLLEVAENGLMNIDGASVDLSRGTLTCDGLQLFGAGLGAGIFDAYWGMGKETNELNPGNFTLPSPTSPFHQVTNTFNFFPAPVQTAPQNATASANIEVVNASNITFQVVFVGNTNSGITTSVHFLPTSPFAIPVVQLQAVITNTFGIVLTNTLYIEDAFGVDPAFALVIPFTQQGIPYISQTGAQQLIPENYTIGSQDNFGFSTLPLGNTPFNTSIIPGNPPITNEFVALGLNIEPVTFTPDPNVPNQNLTNIPGRIVIHADTTLNLSRAQINGPNTLRIVATNHFAGSANAQISSPNIDINVATTNGQLAITNLISPFLPDFVGTIDLYSARWTNIVGGVTNEYHVLMVDSRLAPTALPLLQNFLLRSTNVVISDVINIASNLLINATSLTITTNLPGAQTPYGQLNLQSANLVWTQNLPVLQNLTNFGLITSPNAVFFEEIGELPYFSTNFTGSYQSFVNHGSVITSGNSTWANYFENTGVGVSNVIVNPGLPATTNQALIFSTTGPISIEANTAKLANGLMGTTSPGDISFNIGSLSVSNHAIIVSGALNLTVTNQLSDGGVASNFWSVTDGINLLIKPALGDLLGTTVTNTAAARLEVDNLWAGEDRGPVPAGFLNNGALGHLILDGGNVIPQLIDDPQFHFLGPDPTETTNYAIYVDLLELRNGATNNSVDPNNQVTLFSTFDIEPNMTVYFADAIVGQIDLSEKLNGANGGRLVWVRSFAGIFSGTNLVSNGVTNRFNRALATSTDIDSDGDGSPNVSDSTPFYTANNINLSVKMTNLPARTPAISWFSLANATNFLYYRTNLTSTNWLTVTNFVQTLPSRTVTVLDRGRTNSTGFYKVQVNPIQP